MHDFFVQLSPLWQALLAGTFTWSLTAMGATTVFFKDRFSERSSDVMMGFAAGVMIAAGFWSLLAPSILILEHRETTAWLGAALGFLAGAGFIRLADRVIPHLHPSAAKLAEPEGPPTKWRRSTLLLIAMTLHNIPEGAAVGIAYGALAHQTDYALSTTMAGAIALTLGIGLQNIPEGLAVAMPLRQQGRSKGYAFFYGQASALVEPAAAVLGALAVMQTEWILPYALAFAAGAMVFVSVEELIPESQSHGNTDLATLATIAGFTVMMCLDVGLG
ncbi:MAG: ZIP family metal transporter [Phycisphaerae bacterium]|nr:ZIP family metal transporter [Phycisphaerae bacterium]